MSFKGHALAAIVITLTGLAPAAAQDDPLKVVASFSIIGDLATEVGGDRVTVQSLVGPDGDAHVYEPRPADAGALAQADVVLVNGLGFEGFIDRLVKASGTKASLVTVSDGIEVLANAEAHGHHDHEAHGHDDHGHHHHGPNDPHAWQSVPNVRIYVKRIAEAFCAADADGCQTYEANAGAYDSQLAKLDEEIRAELSAIPPGKRRVITSHEAFGYFAREYGIEFLAPEGVSTESEASAADVAMLIRQTREDKAFAIFVESITNPRLVEQIAAETGLAVGGHLYSDALSGPEGPAGTYLDMMRHNLRTIKGALPGN